MKMNKIERRLQTKGFLLLISLSVLIWVSLSFSESSRSQEQTDVPIAFDLRLPINGVIGVATSEWSVGTYSGHNAADLNKNDGHDEGEDVISIGAGRVADTFNGPCSKITPNFEDGKLTNGNPGCYVKVDHQLATGSTAHSEYFHLRQDSVLIFSGTPIAIGQHIGDLGDTGSSGGAHLHLGLTVDGVIQSSPINFIMGYKHYLNDAIVPIMFNETNFVDTEGGWPLELRKHRLELGGSEYNDNIESIFVPTGWKLTLYDNQNDTLDPQTQVEIASSYINLDKLKYPNGKSVSNTISAIWVEPIDNNTTDIGGGGNPDIGNGQPTPQSPQTFTAVVGSNLPQATAKFFKERYFVDPIAAFPKGGPYNLGQPQLFSIDLPDGWSVKLFRSNSSNRCFSGDIHNLMDHEEWWRETAQVMLFDHNECQPVQQASGPSDEVQVCTYDNACYNFRAGVYKDLTKMPDTQKGGNLNDKISKISWVGNNMSIRMVREVNMVGESYCYSYARELHAEQWRELKNQVSSFQVFNSPNCPPEQSAVPILHDDIYFQGTEFALGLNYGHLDFLKFPHGDVWNDKAESISIPLGASVWKAEHPGMDGHVDCHPSDYQFDHVTGISDIYWAPNGNCVFFPETPKNLRVTGATQHSVALAWEDVTIGKINEAGYNLEQWDGSKFVSKKQLAANSTSYTYTGLTCGTEYTFKLDAYETLVDGRSGQLVIKGKTNNCPPPPDCNTPTFSGVGLYQDKSCNGEGVELKEAGWYHLDKFNNTASSVYVAPGWSLEVFDNIGSSDGYYSCVTQSKWDLGVDSYFWTENKINDSITSLRVYHDNNCGKSQPAYGNCDNVTFNGVMFFDYPHCQGSELGFASPTATNFTTFDNLASSVYIPDGWSVHIYATPSGVGKSFCATNTLWDLQKWNYSATEMWIENNVTYAKIFHDDHCGDLPASSLFSPADGLTVQSGDQILLQWSDTGAHKYWGEVWGSDNFFHNFGVDAHSYLLTGLQEGKYTWRLRGAIDEHLSELSETTFYVGSHCENQTGGVILFDRTVCRGDQEPFVSPGYYSLSELDNRASSIFVANGWSVEVFENTSNSDGLTTCFNESKWNLSNDNYWLQALAADGTISSVRVWDVPNCGREIPIVGCDQINSTDIVLFDHTHCLGLDKSLSSPGFYTLGDFDNLASSVYVPSGKSVRLYMNADKVGNYVCARDTKWDTHYDYYWWDNTQNLFNNISAIEIFNDSLCGGVPTPTGISPTNGTQISDLDELTIQWDNIYAGGYWVEMWGPNGYFKSSGHLTHNEWTVGNLLPGSYVFRLVGEVFGEVGPVSEEVHFEVTDSAPSPNMTANYALNPNQVNKVMFTAQNCSGQWVRVVFGDGGETDSPCNSGKATIEHDYPYDGSAVTFNATVGGISLTVIIPTAASNKSCGELFPNAGVTLFTERECQSGTSRTFSAAGTYTLTDLNNQVSAIVPAIGWSVEVFENSGSHDGHAYCVTRDIWDLSYESYYSTQGYTLDDNISAIRVYDNPTCGKQLPQYGGCDDNIQYDGIVLFDYIHCGGSELSINQAGKYELGYGGSFNDLASSAHVDPGWSVKVYEHSGWTGNDVCLTTDMWDLGVDTYWSTDVIVGNTISSIQVMHSPNCQETEVAPQCDAITSPGVVLFDSHYCLGNTQNYTGTGLFNLAGFDNQTTSLYVQPGWSVYLFEGVNGVGAYRCTNINMWDMRVDSYYQPPVAMDNTVSSILIVDDPECTTLPDQRIQIVEPLTIEPTNPVANQPVIAKFKLQNVGDETLVLRMSAAGRAFCENWDCTNFADFPWTDQVSILPGQVYEYEQSWVFPEEGEYFHQIVYQFGTADWPRLGSRVFTTVEPGIKLVKDLFFNTYDPVVRQPVTAKYVLKNASSRPLTIRTSAAGKGPNCSDWSCLNWADFSWTEWFTLQPGELYNYEQVRDFTQVGEGYFAQALYQFGADDWNHLGTKVDFSVDKGLEVFEGLTLSPTVLSAQQPVTAKYLLKNVSGQPLTIRTGAAGRRDCNTWECTNYADFPWTDRITIQPGNIYTYEQSAALPQKGQYFHQITYQFGTSDWPNLGNRVDTTVEKGVEVVEDLKFSPTQPVENQPVTSTFKIRNSSSQDMVIRLSAAAQGPNCTGWESCQNYADFPWVEHLQLSAGEEYSYNAVRSFTSGNNYYSQIIYQYGVDDWNHLGTEIDFAVLTDPNPPEKTPIITETFSINSVPEKVDTSSPSTPTNLQITDVFTDSIALQWNAPSSFDKFNVYRSVNNVNFILIWSGATASYVDQGLSCFSTYYYRVSAVMDDSESILSDSLRADTKACGSQPQTERVFLPVVIR